MSDTLSFLLTYAVYNPSRVQFTTVLRYLRRAMRTVEMEGKETMAEDY